MQVIPHLTCRDALAAISFYERAFGAKPTLVLKTPDGALMHACLELDGARFHLNDEFVENDVRSPLALGGTPVTIHLGVADCDTAYDRAFAAGCVVVVPLEMQFWGDRFGMVRDPFGHQWSIATPGDSLSPEAMEQAIAAHVTANVP